MSEIEKAKIYHVTGTIDRPERSGDGIKVMFNPSSLKVTLANAIGENQRGANSRAAQYVDKSSSSLTVELIFDSTAEKFETVTKDHETYSARKDVRKYTGEIANAFMKQEGVGNKRVEPKRCMFVWGSFKFVGIMESFDETLDFFSKEGTPLRSTVSIKLTESRFQFESETAKEARQRTPRLGRDNECPHEANHSAGQNPKDWRDTSMYNGVESPRMPSTPSIAVPSMSSGAAFSAGMSGGTSIGIGAGGGVSGGAIIAGGINASAVAGIGIGGSAVASAGLGMNVSSAAGVNSANNIAVTRATPAFSFGASASLGSTIPGAFSPNTKVSVGVTAGSIVASMNSQFTMTNQSNASFSKSYSTSTGFSSGGTNQSVNFRITDSSSMSTSNTSSTRFSGYVKLGKNRIKGSVGFD